VFDDTKLGTLSGNTSLVVKVILLEKCELIATCDHLKSELTKLANLGIIKIIVEPTEWVSQMTMQMKKS